MKSGAEIQGDYRYELWRHWDPKLPPMRWVMLNPSTADASEDDPTIRRCIGFAERENCGGIIVLNLFALRATNPKELVGHPDPVGERNDWYLNVNGFHLDGAPLVFGWGAAPVAEQRGLEVHAMLAHLSPVCLGKTKSGAPKHPLYIKSDAPLIPY